MAYSLPRFASMATRRHLLAMAALLGCAVAAQAQTTTPFTCANGKSYVLQGNATYAVELDVTTGNVTNTSGPITSSGGNVKFNAVGYNQKDNYIWGLVTGNNQLVQVGGDYKANLFSVTGLTGDAVNSVVGDVSATGLMYITRGGSTGGNATSNSNQALTIYTIDLTKPSSPNTYAATVFGTMPAKTSAGGVYINDWAISPVDGHLYAIYATISAAGNASALTLYRILTMAVTTGGTTYAAGTVQALGTVVPDNASGATNAITFSNYASSFMSSNGALYVVSSDNGYIYRIDSPHTASYASSTTSFTGYYVGTGVKGVDSNVDGARCIASSASPLPVQLVSFAATAAPNRTVRLDWTTASELNNDHFEVQRSLDGRTFAVVGQVQGHGTAAQASTYSFTDAAPGKAATYYYRLRQVDTDASFDFSPVRVVTLAAGSSAVQLSVAPNPTTAAELRVQVQYAGTTPAAATLRAYSLLGACVLAQPVTLQPGTNVLAPGTALPAGVYRLSVDGAAALGRQGVKVLLVN